MIEFILSVLRAGVRSRAFHAIATLGFALVGVAFLAASFSPRQPQTVALDVGLSGIRFSVTLLALFWVQDFVVREIERKSVLYALSYPVSRATYLMGRLVGVLILLALATALLGALLQFAVANAGGHYTQEFPPTLGFAYWASLFGLWLGVAVVTSVTFTLAALSTVSLLPLAAGTGFAIAGQSLGAVADYLASGADGQDELVATYRPIVMLIRYVLPNLSRLDWRTWPLYGLAPASEQIALSVVMAFAYVATTATLAVWVFGKRDFA